MKSLKNPGNKLFALWQIYGLQTSSQAQLMRVPHLRKRHFHRESRGKGANLGHKPISDPGLIGYAVP
jgi:hypothetical protein